MGKAQDRGRLDWAVELAGATALAAAVAFAAMKFAPELGWSGPAAMAICGAVTFAGAWGAVRLVQPEPRRHRLPAFTRIALKNELLLDHPVFDVLLLDRPMTEKGNAVASAELLLDDALTEPSRDSRVVQLFANAGSPTPGQLKQRIDRHLGANGRSAHDPAASEALTNALAELRRTLRQA